MTVFFGEELEGVAIFWRIYRRDGVTIGLVSHDRSLYFDGITHRAAPGVVPSAIRRTSGLEMESAEVEGALTHDTIRKLDLQAGRYDNAQIEVGAVNWETLDRATFYVGKLGEVIERPESFSATLRSAKQDLERELVPYTSPTCRAEFCGLGCSLSAHKYTHITTIDALDFDNNSVIFSGIVSADYLGGTLCFLEGSQAGVTCGLVANTPTGLMVDRPLQSGVVVGTKVRVRQGCDHTLSTCHSRFDNAKNFRGEPFLPGNDLLTRYPKST